MSTDTENLLVQAFRYMPDNEADRLLTEVIRCDMSDKLYDKREEGKGGWHTTECSNDYLMDQLKEHINKGDMIDVINFAGMIHVRTLVYGSNA